MTSRFAAIAGGLLLAVALSAHAQTATQVVRFQVTAINQIAVSGSVAPMIISSAAAGRASSPVTAAGTSYAITTNEGRQKISAALDRSMPAGITLELTMQPPAGATSPGPVWLTTAGADVVTDIPATSAAALPIVYKLAADAAVQLSAPSSRTVTFTIISGT